MKKILFFYALLFVSVINAQQLQNANWCFGDGAGLNFLPNPYNPTGYNTSTEGLESYGSVSDSNGILLFYSNGVTVWNKNHQIMSNGTDLKGHISSAQGVVIIPKPNNNKYYYLVTIDGASGHKKGLFYSVIDMTAASQLGQVMTSAKNINLRDHNNVPINNQYPMTIGTQQVLGNYSEKLTTAKHCNGKDYWLITQITNYVYAYLVTENGISLTPTTISLAPFSLTEEDSQHYAGHMKISPDGKKFASCGYYAGTSNTSVIEVGNFNNATGEIVFDNLLSIANNKKAIGIEFSPSSQYFFISTREDVYRTKTDGTEPFTQINIPSSDTYKYGLQLAMNGKIYVCDHVVYGSNHLSVINDPDNPTDPDYQDSDITITYGLAKTGLPQLVLQHDSQCNYSTTLTSPDELYILPYTYTYSAFIITEQNYAVNDNQNITLQAGEYIIMNPNTYIDSGSNFLAHIKECGICEETQGRIPVETTNQTSNILQETKLDIYPNPTNSIVNLKLENELINEITISTLTGVTVLHKNITQPTNNQTIDINTLSKGMYIVTTVTSEGKAYSNKLLVE